MQKHIVQCRICKEKFDTNKLIKDIDWVMPSKNWYYHKTCYMDWAKKKNDVHSEADEEMWLDALWNYLARDLKINPDFIKIKAQWDSFIKKGKTPKGIYFCIRYFYEVKKGDKNKSEGGIGIIPYIYEEGAAYWVKKELEDKGICTRIEQQIKEAQNREKIIVKQNKQKNKRVKKYDLSIISEMENIE